MRFATFTASWLVATTCVGYNVANASAAATTSVIYGFAWVQTQTSTIGSWIQNNSMVNVADVANSRTSMSIVAFSNRTAEIAKVVFWFDNVLVVTELLEPYALNGRIGTTLNPYPSTTALGTHNLTVQVFGGAASDSAVVETQTLLYSVIVAVERKSMAVTKLSHPIVRFELVECDNLNRQTPLSKVLDLASFGKSTALTIVAVIRDSPAVSTVNFWFDGVFIRNEAATPWALNGNIGTQYIPFEPLALLGSHTVSAEALNAKGVSIGGAGRKSFAFQVIRNNNAPVGQPVTPRATPTAPVKRPSPVFLPTPIAPSTTPAVNVVGELKKWHKVTFVFTGPMTSETATPNPFMDYRLDVTFVHTTSGKLYKVPGYYAADGNAAETSATSGNKWICHFAPDQTGKWTYSASFVTGSNVGVSTSGSPTAFHGQTGSLTIGASDKSGRDLRGKGRLQYVGAHHLRFAEGEWFLKVGADSPENVLAYDDFDGTPNVGNRRKSWSPHRQDYVSGNPTWKGGKGSEIVGAINYLSHQSMNAFSFLTMNINGDDQNVFPYISATEHLRMDVSKLAQWEIVFTHADTMGMYLHFKTQEIENCQLLDGGALGNERKLYYRELIARFGHHLALNWNLGEEITNTIPQIKSFSDYFKKTDPYQHPVVTHTYVDSNLYKDLLGHPTFDGASLQTRPSNVYGNTLRWVQASATKGRKWIVANDEQNPQNNGVLPDAKDSSHSTIRIDVLWGNIMAGGAGVEYYFGYEYTNSDMTCQDYRSRANMWTQSRFALEFFTKNKLPFWSMFNNNALRVPKGSTDRMLQSVDGTVLVIQRRGASSLSKVHMVNLSNKYSVKWYDPRNGGKLQKGSIQTLLGGLTNVSYGAPPDNPSSDWIVLIQKV